MSSRALSLATVIFLIGFLAAASAQAQNLEAGKSPAQIFAGTCTECHKSSRGLLKTVPAGSLPDFLHQHYTTSAQMASVLSAYLIANGAADRRLPGGQPKPGVDARPGDIKPADQADRRGRRLRAAEPSLEAPKPDAEPRQAARPDADGAAPQAERKDRKRLVRPGEAPDSARPADGQAEATGERGPDDRRSAGSPRRGAPGDEELPKTDAAKTDAAKDESPKGEPPANDDKPAPETAKGEDSGPEVNKSEGARSPDAGRLDSDKIDAPNPTDSGTAPVLRADPVPPVTPAPADSAPSPAGTSDVTPERAAAPPAPAAPPSATASVPPPAAPTGPPVPPISQ